MRPQPQRVRYALDRGLQLTSEILTQPLNSHAQPKFGMGRKRRTEHPDVQPAMMTLEAAIRPSPVVLGGVAPTPEQANAMIGRGYRALVVGFDWSLLQRGIAAAIAGVAR